MKYDELITKLPKVGQGKFSVVYKKSDSKVVIKSKDPVKECMSLGWFPNTTLFPKIEYIEHSSVSDFVFYESKYYANNSRNFKKDLLPFEYEFYSELRKLRVRPNTKPQFLYQEWIYQFDNLPNKFYKRKEHLIEAVTSLMNYGEDICFEISPRNIKVEKGKLILLDCFFLFSKLR